MALTLYIIDLVLAILMSLSSTAFSVVFYSQSEYVRAVLWTIAALAWILLLIKSIIDLVNFRRKKKRVDSGLAKVTQLLEDDDVKEIFIQVDKDACTINAYKVEIDANSNQLEQND